MKKVAEFLSSKDVNAHSSIPGLKDDFIEKAFHYTGGERHLPECE